MNPFSCICLLLSLPGLALAQNNYIANISNAPSPGSFNTLVGHKAGFANVSGHDNAFLGYIAGDANTSGSFNAFIGSNAGGSNTTGYYNVFMGYVSGSANTMGHENAFVGTIAGYYNTTGSYNSFVGTNAGTYNSTGDYNTFLGHQAGYNNTIGTGNTFLGWQAGYNATTGSNNIIIGPNSGTTVTTGSDNVLMGYRTRAGDGKGKHNIIIGGDAGGGRWAGTSNTLIGYQSSAESADLQNATAIGAEAKVTVSNALILGNNANVGIGTSAPTARLEVVSDAANDSGLRLTKLTASSQPTHSTDQFLTVNEQGDVVKARYRLLINNTSEWSDHVFTSTYRLRPLVEVAQYIKLQGHLPGVPSALDVVEQGMDAARMDAKLLEKIEELTLYSIQMEKTAKAQQATIEQQQAAINDLKRLVKQLVDKR